MRPGRRQQQTRIIFDCAPGGFYSIVSSALSRVNANVDVLVLLPIVELPGEAAVAH